MITGTIPHLGSGCGEVSLPEVNKGSTIDLLLDHLGLNQAAAQINDAVEADIASRGTSLRTTEEVGEAIAQRIAEARVAEGVSVG